MRCQHILCSCVIMCIGEATQKTCMNELNQFEIQLNPRKAIGQTAAAWHCLLTTNQNEIFVFIPGYGL